MTGANDLPYLMNSATFTRNTLPQRGATGRIGATHRGIVRETPESVKRAYGVDVTADELARNAVRRSDEAEPDKTEEPALWLHWADHRLREVAARHGCVRRDDATRIITDALALASDDDRTFDLDYLSEIVAREADATTERNNAKMDAQQPLPEPTKPPAAKTTAPHWSTDTEKVTAITDRLKAQGIDIDFARNAAGLKPGELLSAFKGSGNDFYRAAEAAHKAAQAKRAADLDDILGPDAPAEPLSQKPAEKAPSSPVTPAPATDVPAPRSDATVTLETAKAGKSEPTPEPAHVAPAAPRYEEWPFVALLTMYSPEGLEMKYTLRAASDAQLLDAERAFVARRLAAGYTTTRQMGGPVSMPTRPIVAEGPTPTVFIPANPPALPTRDAPLPETVATPAAGGAPDKKGRVPGQTGTDRVTAIARNETNGKSVIEVYCGGKYSDHKLRRDEDVAMLRAAFPALDIAAMTPGTQYPVTATLTWRVTDKLNDKGTYWRDVVSIVA